MVLLKNLCPLTSGCVEMNVFALSLTTMEIGMVMTARLSPGLYPTLMEFFEITSQSNTCNCNVFHTFSGVITTQETLWIYSY